MNSNAQRMAEPSPAVLDDGEDVPDVYNATEAAGDGDLASDATIQETASSLVAAATQQVEADAAAAAAAEAAEKIAAQEAVAAAKAKAEAEAEAAREAERVAAEVEAAAKAEAKAAAEAAKIALAKAEAEAAEASRLAAKQAEEAAAAAATPVGTAADLEDGAAAEGGEAGGEAADPGEKFVRVVSECGKEVSGRLSTLGFDDLREGTLLLSSRYVERSKLRLTAFKGHALDLAETACAPSPEGGSVVAALRKQIRLRQVAELPIGAVYALLALLFFTMFAVVHFPSKYVPLGVAYAKQKMVEYHVQEKAGAAALALQSHATTALKAAAESDVGKKSFEAAKGMRAKIAAAATQAAASSVATSSAAMADGLRVGLGQKLGQMRDKGPAAPAPVVAVPASPNGEEKV